MEVQQRLLDQQKELCLGLVHNKPRIEEQSLNSMHVIKTLVSHQNVDETATKAIAAGVKGYKALLRSQDGLAQSSSNSYMFVRGPDSLTCLEQDFTTNGAQGNLDCPFSKPHTPVATDAMDGDPGPKVQADICGNDDLLDPIKAEQDERRSSTAPSAQTSGSRCPVSRCPIRYMDKHSPEEIAEYVERHKHELPRSHTICVKRYQKDPQNIDAKYGGLINVISGLSAKHQAYLPSRAGASGGSDKRQTAHSAHSDASTQRVEKWAENVDPVDATLNAAAPIEQENDNDNRESRFDRPLREVRLGESPSRPWGIHVPPNATQETNASVPISGSVPDPVSAESHPISPLEKAPADVPAKPAGRCPFGHDALKSKPADPPAAPASSQTPNPALLASPWADSWGLKSWDLHKADEKAKAEKVEDPTAKTDTPPMPSHVTFNGPVFFGYSAEQTASLLQQLRDLNPPK